MKYLLLFILHIPFFSFCQTDSLLTYTEVVQVEGNTKDQLFIKGRQWYNEAFKSSKDVLQINDKESGELAGKGYMEGYYHYKVLGKENKYPVDVFFKCNVWVKEGKYKYELTGFDVKTQSSNNTVYDIGTLTTSNTCPVKWSMVRQKTMDEIWADVKKSVDIKASAIIQSLKDAMNNKVSKSDF